MWYARKGGNDIIVGTMGNDQLLDGDNGNDIIQALGGNDLMKGGNGNDWLVGGSGNDILIGEAGNDIIQGGIGNNDQFYTKFSTFRYDLTLDDMSILKDTWWKRNWNAVLIGLVTSGVGLIGALILVLI
jgi:Ca2+-binding RTX toxin-like protein